jgi:hypothetical protein
MTLFLHQYGSRLPLRAFALAFLAVIPQGSAVSSLAFAVASEIGPGFSPDTQPLHCTRALAPGTLPWDPPQ